jgi:hypothetical protein
MALLMPGCYTYESTTADVGFMADGWGDSGSEEDVAVNDAEDTTVPDVIGEDTAEVSDDVAECTCTCEPKPCTCTCEAGEECVFDPNAFPEKGRVGGDPCETNDQCMTGLCATTTLLGGFWAGATAKDGMCTMLGCGSDADCGEGGACLDPTSLDPTIPYFLCGAACDTDADCRCGVDYVCVDSLKTDDDGNPIKACMPSSLANLLACGKVACE